MLLPLAWAGLPAGLFIALQVTARDDHAENLGNDFRDLPKQQHWIR